MATLAAAGTLETAYLTLSKLLHTSVTCPTDGCESVLSSPYAVLFGLPLPLYGMAAYAAVAAAAVVSAQHVQQGRQVPERLCMALASGCGVLAASSTYLMYILHTALGGASCVWCYGSATLSAALLATLVVSMSGRQLADAAAPGLGATAAAALALYLGFGPIDQSSAQSDFELPYVAPEVTSDSSAAAAALAKKLKAAGAKMYGAFWCTHCFDQKQAFGIQAMPDFPYVECYPDGWHKVSG